MSSVRSGTITANDGVVFRLPRDQKSHLQESMVETLSIPFFDNNGIIHKEFVPAGQTINAAFYQHFEPIARAYSACLTRVVQDWKMDAAPR